MPGVCWPLGGAAAAAGPAPAASVAEPARSMRRVNIGIVVLLLSAAWARGLNVRKCDFLSLDCN
jgi:hypothetical protein